MRRNSEAWPRSQSLSVAWAALMWATNSSVTLARATSVMSSLCLLMRPSSRSKGPEKTSRCTSNGADDRRVMTPAGGQLLRRGRRARRRGGSRADLSDASGDLGEGSVVGVDRGAVDGVLLGHRTTADQAAAPRAMSSRASWR